MSNTNNNLQTQTSNALHNAIMEVGGKDRPPMLAPEGYIENYKNVSQDIRDQLNVEAETKAIERLKQGESINVQNLETNLYWEFGKFTSRDGESLESYYSRTPIYDQEPAMVANDDEISKEIEIDKLMDLISLSFMKIYKPTNKNRRTSSNTNRANQDVTLRINRGTWYDNHRAINTVGARENVGTQVIQNGNNLKRTGRDHDGGVIILPPTTAEEHIAVQRESKARTTLLQSIPDDHVADFHYMDDERDIWNAVKARFDRNAKSKKKRNSMLKQEFSEFRIGDAGEFALMSVTSEKKVRLAFTNCISENKLGWDDSAFSVFTTNSKDVEGRPIFHSLQSSTQMTLSPVILVSNLQSPSQMILPHVHQLPVQNRPFPVPTDRRYSPSVSSGWWKRIDGQLLLSPQQVILGNHIEKVYTGYPRTIVDLIHLHTNANVADLLTKAFDGPRVFNSPILHLLRVEMVINSPWIMPILGTKELATSEQTAPDFSNILFKNQSSRYVVPTGRVIVPTGRVIVPTGRYVVPTGRVIVATGRYIVPTEQADWRDDTNDEPKDQELEAHYMYMAHIQKVTPDAADNYGPIFNTEPLQKVQNDDDNYNVFSNDQEHHVQPKSVNDTYMVEQGDTNITIGSLDMSTNGETIDQDDDDDDLANECDLLASLIDKLKCKIDDSKNRNKFLESSNKTLVDKLKGVIPTTSVSRPPLKSNQMEDRVMPINSKGKKQEVEEHYRNFKFSNNKTSITACNDSLNAKTSNVNFVYVTCGKCVLNNKHDMCVLRYINGMNSRTRQPIVVPISTREPKRNVDQSVITSYK
uniref:Xylulose kinase-1 n=1 Tax=Tanacetum cinerariifolium TaxID=118510 RepID=A0A6L2MM25_TANCI|nr:xylulose kinase-1 [Tanacetum cinerariifolium]